MTIADILNLLVDRTDEDRAWSDRVIPVRPTPADVAAWCAETGMSPTTLFNELGLALARAYDSGALSFTACDFIANELFAYTLTQELQTDVFWDVYDAFDAGEYYHDDDDRAEDPEETYTRPLIKALLSRAENA